MDLCRLCMISSSDSEGLVKIFNEEDDKQTLNKSCPLADKIFATVGCKVSYKDGLPDFLCKGCLGTVDFIAAYNWWFRDIQACITRIQTTLEICKDSDGWNETGQQTLLSLSSEGNNIEKTPYLYSFVTTLSNMPSFNSAHVSLLLRDELAKACAGSSVSLESTDQGNASKPASSCNFLDCHGDWGSYPKPKDQNQKLPKDQNIKVIKDSNFPTSMEHDDIGSGVAEDPAQDEADWYEDDKSTESKSDSELSQKEIEDRSSGEKFMCQECQKSFDKKSLLRKHLVSHSGAAEKYQCEVCTKIFISILELQRHARVHLGLKPYKCTKCSKSFSQKNLLDIHKNWHEGRKNYLCEVCGQNLSTKSNLRTHMKSLHTAEKDKPFKCEVCGKSFFRKHHLDNHTTVHLSIRPHQCTICGMTFKRLSQLQEHENGHSGEKKYICKDCNRSFSTKRVLNVHMLLHSGVKQHHCAVCKKSFIRRSGLLVHLKTHSK